MTENPARELAELLDGWYEPGGGSGLTQRDPTTRQDLLGLDLWRRFRRGIDLCQAVEAVVESRRIQGFRVSHYEKLIGQLYKAAVAPTSDWRATDQTERDALPTSAHLLLLGLADLIDAAPAQGPNFVAIAQHLAEARSVVEGFSGEDAETEARRLHLLFQIQLAQRLVTEMDRLDADFVATVLTETVHEAADFTNSNAIPDEAENSRFRGALRDLLLNLAASGIWAGGAAAVYSGPEILQLLSGG